MITNKKPLWYAVHTMPRWEKKVKIALEEQNIEVYSPVQKRLKQWSDRKKWVEEPVIRSYVFVRIAQKEYMTVLKAYGVLRFVCFEHKAVPIPEYQIEILKNLIENNIEIEMTSEKFEPGDMIEITNGPLKGLRAELIKYKGKKKVLIQLCNITESFLIDISPSAIQKLKS